MCSQKKPVKPIFIWIRSILFVSIFTLIFIFITTWVHEFGHMLACKILGVPIIDVTIDIRGWRIEVGYVADPRINTLIGLSGGLFNFFFLLLIYGIVARFVKVERQLTGSIMDDIKLGCRMGLMAAFMESLTNAIVEGFFKPVYGIIFNSPIYLSVVLTYALLSLEIHNRWPEKLGIFKTEKSETTTIKTRSLKRNQIR